MNAGPLARYRMVDLSRQLPGPFCSTLLADLGMDVLTVTAPVDPFGAGIPFLQRNKRSMTLNLKATQGRDLLVRLGRYPEARAEFERAASLTANVREREMLLARARACVAPGG